MTNKDSETGPFLIRRVKAQEWEKYRAIRLEALKDSPRWFAATFEDAVSRTEESWRKQVEQLASSPADCSFLAENGDLVVGIMSLYSVDTGVGELMQVWVSPRFRGTNLACELFGRVLEWARNSGFQRLILKVRPDNSRAVHFYEKIGFQGTQTTDAENVYELKLPGSRQEF